MKTCGSVPTLNGRCWFKRIIGLGSYHGPPLLPAEPGEVRLGRAVGIVIA